MENSNTGTDEATLLAARGVSREHAVTHRAPDTGHEHPPALHEGRPYIILHGASFTLTQ